MASATDTDAPTTTAQGLFAEVVKKTGGDAELADQFTQVFIPYKAKGTGDAGKIYSDSLTDGYARLTQVAHRVTRSCPTTKLILLGQGQAGHLVSFFASEIGKGQQKAIVDPDKVIFAATVSDPSRGEGQPLFPGVPGQSAPETWGATTSSTASSGSSSRAGSYQSRTGSGSTSATTGEQADKPATSITEYADLAKSPSGAGLNPQAQHITDFGALTGKVAQFCVTGDLSCAAPANAALGRAALSVMESSDADFSRDPLGAASITAQALTATAATGVAKHAGQDYEGDSLATIVPTGDHTLSERLESAASPAIRPQPSTKDKDKPGKDDPTTVTEDGLTALVRAGSIGVNSLATVAGDVLDEDTIASLLAAGITGGATSPELATVLTAKAGASALKLVPPRSLGSRARNVFEALAGEVKDNQELPDLIAAARTWDRLATQDGYIKAPVATSGASTTGVLADWVHAAVADAKTAQQEASATATTSASSSAPSSSLAETSSATSTDHSTTAPASATDGRGSTGNTAGTDSVKEPSLSHTPARNDAPHGPGTATPAPPTRSYDKAPDTGAVVPAGPPVEAAPAVAAAGLYTVADEDNPAPDFGAAPVAITDAGKGTPVSNSSYSVAQRLELLADPAYPRKTALGALAVTGALLPVTYGAQTHL